MSHFNMLERLYNNPEAACGKYEQGIVEGMTYMADKLIWSEQYYIDAFEAAGEITKENWLTRTSDMYTIINDTIQNFCHKNLNIKKLWDNDAWHYYEQIGRKINV